MNFQQLQVSEQSPIFIQEQQQQAIFVPLNNSTLQTPTAHVMPMPPTNWSMESMPWKITKTDNTGEVIEFTAHAPHNNALRRALLHQKRKPQFIATEPLPVKQFISEEKITAHFNGLHISSDYIQHNATNMAGSIDDLPSTSGKCFSNLTYEDYKITAKELEEKLRNANRITLCEELKKFNNEQKKVSYLPEALIHRVHAPCTALVLWQPSPILNIFNQKNNSNIKMKNNMNEQQQNDRIDDYTTSDLSPVQLDDIDDFIDNNNTCNLDFNNVKSDSMDEDL